jgi:phage shock protein C
MDSNATIIIIGIIVIGILIIWHLSQIKRLVREGKLLRSRDDREIAGVCAGLSPIWHLSPSSIRFIFIIFGLSGGIGIYLYIFYWILIPSEPPRVITPEQWH